MNNCHVVEVLIAVKIIATALHYRDHHHHRRRRHHYHHDHKRHPIS